MEEKIGEKVNNNRAVKSSPQALQLLPLPALLYDNVARWYQGRRQRGKGERLRRNSCLTS